MGRGWTAVLAILLLVAVARQSEAADKLRVGVLKLASSGGVFIAAERGDFTAAGVDVELRFFDAAQPIAVAAVAGDVDIGVTGLTAGFYNLAGKGALRIIAGQSREEPGYHLIGYLASSHAYDAGLTELKDLPGHAIGISQVGSTFHYSIGLLAEKLGFPLASLKLVPLQSMANMAAAVKGKQVDASLIPATIALPMIARGEAHLLGWVGDETPWQLGAIFAPARAIAERRAALENFLAGYRRGARAFYQAFLPNDGTPQPDITLQQPNGGSDLLAIIAKYTGQSPDQLRSGIPYIDPDAKLLVEDIHRQVAWYQSQGLVDRSVDARAILDLSFTGGPAAVQ
jgi:NitT/TauT family transport system substrate-binding protein